MTMIGASALKRVPVLVSIPQFVGGGAVGIAGEPGHYRAGPDGRLCGCGNRGCWERYASGSALVAEAREFARNSPEAAIRLLQLGGGTPEGISGPQVTRAAREGWFSAQRIVSKFSGRGNPERFRAPPLRPRPATAHSPAR